jgi:hypothetical protein
MSVKIATTNLVLEITRKCNMSCAHCLRGEAENVNMSRKVVDAVLSQVCHIDMLTFTGGEPMLNTRLMKYVFDGIMERNISVYGVWLATNGSVWSPSFISHFEKFMNEWCLDSESCGIAVSQDQFHDLMIQEKNLSRFTNLPYYDGSKEGFIRNSHILYEGRAYHNAIGELYPTEKKLHLEYGDNGTPVVYGSLYINAYGDVLPDCDFAYENQELNALGNVLKEQLYDILKCNCSKIIKTA